MIDQVSYLCETAGTVTVLYILIFIILYSKWADKIFWHITKLGTVSRKAQWEVLPHQKTETIFFTFRALSPEVKGTGTRLTTHLCLLTSVILPLPTPPPPICHHGMHRDNLTFTVCWHVILQPPTYTDFSQVRFLAKVMNICVSICMPHV